MKRLLDIFLTASGLILLWPFLLIIAIAIRLDSPGGAIYRQTRIGKDGKPFSLYKFRTMATGCDDEGYKQYLTQLIESEKGENAHRLPYQKMEADARVTSMGRFLRRYYLDELPQLVNILKGDMSLVGPRPHVQLEVDHYTTEQRRRLAVKPGMTGSWQVYGKGDCCFSELIQLDLDYIDHWSIGLDFQLIFRTIALLFQGGEGFWTRKPKQVPHASMQLDNENKITDQSRTSRLQVLMRARPGREETTHPIPHQSGKGVIKSALKSNQPQQYTKWENEP